MYPLWILGSSGIGKSMQQTRSLLVAVMLHLVFNFMSSLPAAKSLPVLGISAAAWIYLIATWRRPGHGIIDKAHGGPRAARSSSAPAGRGE